MPDVAATVTLRFRNGGMVQGVAESRGAAGLADALRSRHASGHSLVRLAGWCVVRPDSVVEVVDDATGEVVRVWPDDWKDQEE